MWSVGQHRTVLSHWFDLSLQVILIEIVSQLLFFCLCAKPLNEKNNECNFTSSLTATPAPGLCASCIQRFLTCLNINFQWLKLGHGTWFTKLSQTHILEEHWLLCGPVVADSGLQGSAAHRSSTVGFSLAEELCAWIIAGVSCARSLQAERYHIFWESGNFKYEFVREL